MWPKDRYFSPALIAHAPAKQPMKAAIGMATARTKQRQKRRKYSILPMSATVRRGLVVATVLILDTSDFIDLRNKEDGGGGDCIDQYGDGNSESCAKA